MLPGTVRSVGQTGGVETLGALVGGFETPVLLAAVILVIGLVFRLPPKKALRSAILVGIGFEAVFLLVGFFADTVGRAAARLAATTPLGLSAVDAGWPVAAAVAFGIVEIGFWIVPLFVAVNLALFAVGFTYTLDVDIHNYWHFAFVAGLAFVETGSWLYGVAVGLVLGLFTLVVADWTQPAIEETFDQPNVSIPHGFSAVMAVFAILLNPLFERTPLARVDVAASDLEERLEPLGDSLTLGLVVGLGVGLVANADRLGGPDGWYATAEVAIAFAAIAYLLPEFAGVLMEGITPLSEAVRDHMTDRFEGREFSIGLDSAILVGHPAVATTGLLMVPVALLLMLVLPGNRLLWGVDLATFPFFFAMMVPVFDGSVAKMFVTGVLLLIPVHYIATWLAPLVTTAARSTGMGIGEGVTVTTGLSGSPANGVLVFAPPVGLIVGLVATAVVFVALRTWPTRMYVLAGASEEQAAAATERRHTGESPGLLPNRFGSAADRDE